MESLLQDIKFGVKLLLKDKCFSATAIVTLALCIGANTAIFSVNNAVLLRSLPFDEAERIVLIGSDSPTLPSEFVRDAFKKLETVDGVVGPARDGGYYLIGLRRPCPELFAGIAWSEPDVLQQTLSRARQAGLDLQLLREWYDVDELEDLLRVKKEIRELRDAGSSEFPARTAAFLEEDVPTGGTIL